MADSGYPVVMIGGVPVVEAPQGIDADIAESFRKVLLHAADRGQGTLVVNMTGTRCWDPAWGGRAGVGPRARRGQRW
jgi:hypothetical protein